MEFFITKLYKQYQQMNKLLSYNNFYTVKQKQKLENLKFTLIKEKLIP